MKTILNTAKRFILKKKAEDFAMWDGIEIKEDIQNVFWWNTTLKLYDIPLINIVTKKSAGYFLVSESKQLPPIIEYSTEGLSLKEQIDANIYHVLKETEIKGVPLNYYFMNSTEIYVEIQTEVGKGNFVLNIPNLFVIQKNSLESHNNRRNPQDYFDGITTLNLWNTIENNDVINQTSRVLHWRKPTRYQQNCDSYLFEENCSINFNTPQHYCTPRAISGCTPVAWAMLLSSWKKSTMGNAYIKIWERSNCWDIEWPSYGSRSNPSQCSIVELDIWKIGRYMNTTRDGATSFNQIINGGKIFSDYGLSWKFYRASNESFEWAVKIIDAGQAFMFGGTGEWSLSKKTFIPAIKAEESGHSTVAYGYSKPDRTLLVSLGWGTFYSNKWINHDQYRNRGHTCVVEGLETTNKIEPKKMDSNDFKQNEK